MWHARTQLQGRPHSGRPLNGRTLLFLSIFVFQLEVHIVVLHKLNTQQTDKIRNVAIKSTTL